MKRSIIIWAAAAILAVIALYTTWNYNSESDTIVNPPQVQQADQEIPDTDSDSAQADNSQENQGKQNRVNLMENYDFTLEDLDGNSITLSKLKGKKVFLNFWATWCPPCKAEMPDIEKLYQESKDDGLVILAVNVGEDKKTVQDFMTKSKYNFTVLLDVTGEVSQMYRVSGIPTSYFIDTEGYLGYGVTGAISLESMKEFVNSLE